MRSTEKARKKARVDVGNGDGNEPLGEGGES